MQRKQLFSDIELAWYDSGSGKPILFLHSFGHNKTLWSPQLTYFFERGYRVVAPDMPGHGDSSFDRENHSIDAIARLYVSLCETLGLQRIVVAGISMGGYIALRMWARKPDLISALILSNTKAEADTEAIVARRRTQVANIREHGLEQFVHDGAPKRLAPAVLEKRPWVLDSIKMMNFTVSAEANAATLEAMAAREDETPTLATIGVPTLITAGSDDKFIPPESGGNLRAGIRNSELHVIPESGHVSNLENPTEYNRVLDVFLSNLQ